MTGKSEHKIRPMTGDKKKNIRFEDETQKALLQTGSYSS
jgi:hypothetical protein